MFDRRLVQNFDWLLLALILVIAGIGIVNLYSAGYNRTPDGVTAVYIKQSYWLLVGLWVMFLTLTVDYRHLERLAYPLYTIGIILLLAVMVAGKTVSGSKRWLGAGFFTFQPSELVKIALILVLARHFHRLAPEGPLKFKDIIVPLVLILVPAALIAKQPDLGSAILVTLVGISMILLVGVYWRTLLVGVAGLVSAIPSVWPFLKEYQKQRVRMFLDPERDPLGAGYHIIQSKIAVGSGQFWGKGFLQGTQSQLHFLPEQHTDFAFSVFAEEWGFVGSAVLVFLYLMLSLWGLLVARNCKERFGQLLALGVTALLFWQVFINLCMVTGLMPVVGIPLPLFSYGGSSLITTMLALGLLLNLRMRRFLFGG
uniref:Peptidoglycan glycosyltransferase RodA n=1 Tax=Desulfobacca acetoxidans TaxID=60893 RepID=A0A7C3Z349_9BACT